MNRDNKETRTETRKRANTEGQEGQLECEDVATTRKAKKE